MNLNILEIIRIMDMDFIIVMHSANSVNIMCVFAKVYIYFFFFDHNLTTLIFSKLVYITTWTRTKS
jgi:hypothetical protein